MIPVNSTSVELCNWNGYDAGMDAPDRPARGAGRGRRPGDETTREAILDAAAGLFAERGFERASMRAIATAAGTDPGMIRHWFGDKEGLVAATVADRTPLVGRLASVLADASPGRGRRLADAYLGLWEDDETGPILMALVRSSVAGSSVPAALRQVMGGGVMDREFAGAPDDTGLALVGSHMLGVALTRFVVRVPYMVSIPREVLLDELGPVLDGYLDRV